MLRLSTRAPINLFPRGINSLSSRWSSEAPTESNQTTVKKKNLKPHIFDLLKEKPNRGIGLKFTRDRWMRYPEPCYWVIDFCKLRNKPGPDEPPRPYFKGKQRAWGILTWRGKSNNKIQRVKRPNKREWIEVTDEMIAEKLNAMKLSESAETKGDDTSTDAQ